MGDEHHDGEMASRGVSRPMSDSGGNSDSSGNSEDAGNSDSSGNSEDGKMDRKKMLHTHHEQTLWIYWTLIILGIWMIMSPLTFSYGKDIVQPSGGRSVWLTDAMRISVMQWSDILSGILLVVFGWRSLTPNRPISLWIACFVGIWLNFAPLVFWAPTALIYLNDTLVGVLVVALTILVPGMPNMINYMQMGSEVPPGWTYNPSSWPQRWIMIVLGFLGWVVSRYLGAFQLGFIDYTWDPFFGESSIQVLNSNMSHSLPISDAGLGAFAYTFEFLMGWMGSPSRWRTMPWMVTFFGILVIPLGLVHIFLVISQPVIVGEWCSFCILAAAIMLPMIPLEFDEVIAMGQHMVQAKRRGDNMWHVFWKGGEPFEQNEDDRSPKLMDLPKRPLAVYRASVWGMGVPWNLSLSTLLGIGLVFVPFLFGVDIGTTAAHIFHLGGFLVIVVSVICMGEIVRIGRYLNIALGLVLAVGPWMANHSTVAMNFTGLFVGLAIIALAFRRGPVKEKYGLWDTYVK